MAIYASAVTLDPPKVEVISKNLGILTGSIDITNYNSTTKTAQTDISDMFKTLFRVIVTSSEFGFLAIVDSDCKFSLYEAGAAGAELDECTTDTNGGTFEFLAIGRI